MGSEGFEKMVGPPSAASRRRFFYLGDFAVSEWQMVVFYFLPKGDSKMSEQKQNPLPPESDDIRTRLVFAAIVFGGMIIAKFVFGW